MGRQNFAAGLEMTIGSVVRNYLRWFELNKYKKALRASEGKGTWLHSLFSRRVGSDASATLAKGAESIETHGREGAGGNAQPIDFVDPLT